MTYNNTPLYEDIGTIIKTRRESLNLLQQDVADYVGVTKSAVSRWEKGEIENMGRSKIKRLAEILRLEPSVIIYGNQDIVAEETPYYLNDDTRAMAQEIFENPELRILFDASRKLKKKDIEAVIEITKRLKGTE